MASPETIADRYKKIMEMQDDNDAYTLLLAEYKDFLSPMIDNPAFNELKKSAKFISFLTQICLTEELSYEQRVYCNSMIYKSMMNASTMMKKLLLNLGYVVNRNIATQLIGCGLDQNMASYIAVARKSSFYPRDCISRMNFCIVCTAPDFMTAKRIADIYCIVCNTTDDIKKLFEITMKDAFVYKSDDSWITQDHIKTAKNMDSALLSILNSLNIDSLFNILEEYYQDCQMLNLDEDDVRFSFRHFNCDGTFANIDAVLMSLASHKHYLP